ncbi:MAG TPA: glycerate kinase [Mycobacteriales bacterium]|nr:glycerate kinase [Mycobacteriales bacterium]
MRVVVAPDSYGGSLTAQEVAAAVAAGWRAVSPDDELIEVPLSDGGSGFAAVLATLPAAQRVAAACTGPTGRPLQASVVRIGATAYVESALACGLDLLLALDGDVRTATTYGVGELIGAAADLGGVDTIVVGLGGSGTNDGGAGALAALGAQPAAALAGGGVALRGLDRVDLPASLAVRLVAATDVDSPLLGPRGASAVYGPQKGADPEAVAELEAGVTRWAEAVEVGTGRPGLRDMAGAGAAGGLGFGLFALGAERKSGAELVVAATGLAALVADADLVVTGEGRFDPTSLRGKLPAVVARVAQGCGVPCIVAAGQAAVGTRDAAAHGIDEVWSVTDALGSVDAALGAGGDGVAELGRRIAGAWAR